MARVLILIFLSIAVARARARAKPTEVAEFEASWMESLTNQGFVVQEGTYGLFDVDSCFSSDTCYAINPITPYGLIFLPSHPNETDTSGTYENTCYKHNMCKKKSDGTMLYPGWRLAPGESVLVLGRTPPESTYWSISPSLYTRRNPDGWTSNATGGKRIVACPPGPSRCEYFSSLNDPVNMLTANTSGESAFNASWSLILSTDETSEKVVESALTEQEGPVNRLRFPGRVLRLGVKTGLEDELITVLRVENILDEKQRDAFYASIPMRVFRISPTSERPLPTRDDMFDSFEGRMRNRYTGVGEHAPGFDMKALRSALQELLGKVKSKHGKGLFRRGLASTRFQSFVKDSGYECLKDGAQCQGDTRDTIYAKGTFIVEDAICNKTGLPCKPSRGSHLTDDKSDALYVIGVNHQLTSQSTYSSITIYDYPKLASGQLRSPNGNRTYTEMESSRDIQGSAVKYLGADRPVAEYLYVVKFARKCPPDDFDLCYEVVTNSTDPRALVIAPTSPVFFLERMYIHPGTQSGPATNETILPYLLHAKLAP